MRCTQMRYIPLHSQWRDYILIFTVLIHGIAESGEGAALSLAQAKCWAYAPSVMFGQLSPAPVSCVPWVHHDAGAPQLSLCWVPEAAEVFRCTPGVALGLEEDCRQDTRGIFLPVLFSLLLYMTPDVCLLRKGTYETVHQIFVVNIYLH